MSIIAFGVLTFDLNIEFSVFLFQLPQTLHNASNFEAGCLHGHGELVIKVTPF